MNIYQITMLIIISAFYFTYVVKRILLKRQGIESARLAKGSKPKSTFLTELILLVSTTAMSVIQYASILFERNLDILLTFPAVRWAGVMIALAGTGFFISAVIAMKDSWRAGVEEDQNTKIVTKGVYRISRNPAFVGFDLMYLGTALAFSNIVCVIAVILLIPLFHLQILEEEKLLPKIFGSEYLAYKERTRRYL